MDHNNVNHFTRLIETLRPGFLFTCDLLDRLRQLEHASSELQTQAIIECILRYAPEHLTANNINAIMVFTQFGISTQYRNILRLGGVLG